MLPVWSGMSSLQYCELLAKGEVFQKQPSMSVEEAAGSLPLGAK